MVNQVVLLLFIFFLSLGLGGGLYETLAVYPNWKRNPIPEEFGQKLRDSGQALAGRRFWPLISPVTALLALINLIIARHQPGVLRTVWLISAAAVLIKSIATYTYFVPTMILKLGRAAELTPEDLARTVRQWTTLSPYRLCLEFFGWIAAVSAWSLLQRT